MCLISCCCHICINLLTLLLFTHLYTLIAFVACGEANVRETFPALFLSGGEGNTTVPYWGQKDWHGEKGNHNFCESDYTFSSYIVEFHNVWSSIPIVFYGSVGSYYARLYAVKHLRFSACFVAAGCVGIGMCIVGYITYKYSTFSSISWRFAEVTVCASP